MSLKIFLGIRNSGQLDKFIMLKFFINLKSEQFIKFENIGMAWTQIETNQRLIQSRGPLKRKYTSSINE